jgi:hypothetical protein
MTYLMSWERDNRSAKLESIQDNYSPDYFEEEETEEDFFGFGKVISLDHLTEEELDLVGEIFNDYK